MGLKTGDRFLEDDIYIYIYYWIRSTILLGTSRRNIQVSPECCKLLLQNMLRQISRSLLECREKNTSTKADVVSPVSVAFWRYLQKQPETLILSNRIDTSIQDVYRIFYLSVGW